MYLWRVVRESPHKETTRNKFNYEVRSSFSGELFYYRKMSALSLEGMKQALRVPVRKSCSNVSHVRVEQVFPRNKLFVTVFLLQVQYVFRRRTSRKGNETPNLAGFIADGHLLPKF